MSSGLAHFSPLNEMRSGACLLCNICYNQTRSLQKCVYMHDNYSPKDDSATFTKWDFLTIIEDVR